jgi:hypothetical protein
MQYDLIRFNDYFFGDLPLLDLFSNEVLKNP